MSATSLSIRAMVRGGAKQLRTHWRMFLALYLVQLLVTLLFLFTATRVLASIFAERQLFDQGVNGHVAALIEALRTHGHAMFALLSTAVAMAVAYAVLSLYLTAGMLGVLVAKRFGETAGRTFWPYARLWGWSLIPTLFSLLVIGVGQRIVSGPIEHTFSLSAYVGLRLLGALPGLTMLAVTFCAIDYARISLVRDPSPATRHALWRSIRLIFSHANPLPHYAAYLGVWMSISLLYILVAQGPWAGSAAALALFLVRQITTVSRFVARAIAYGGQTMLHR